MLYMIFSKHSSCRWGNKWRWHRRGLTPQGQIRISTKITIRDPKTIKKNDPNPSKFASLNLAFFRIHSNPSNAIKTSKIIKTSLQIHQTPWKVYPKTSKSHHPNHHFCATSIFHRLLSGCLSWQPTRHTPGSPKQYAAPVMDFGRCHWCHGKRPIDDFAIEKVLFHQSIMGI